MKTILKYFFIYFTLFVSIPLYAQKYSLPSGWDDANIDAIRHGKSLLKTIGVLGFKNAEKIKGLSLDGINEYLETALKQTNKFDVKIIDSARVAEINQVKNLSIISDPNDDQLIKIGQEEGVNYIVTGAFQTPKEGIEKKFAYDVLTVKVGISIRLVDIETSKVLISKSSEGVIKKKQFVTSDGTEIEVDKKKDVLYMDAAKLALNNTVSLLSKLIVIGGEVADIKGDIVTLAIGQAQGVKSGDKLVVLRVGNKINNPSTGQFMGYQKDAIALLEVKSVELNMCKAEITDTNSDKKITKGDIAIVQN